MRKLLVVLWVGIVEQLDRNRDLQLDRYTDSEKRLHFREELSGLYHNLECLRPVVSAYSDHTKHDKMYEMYES